MFLCKKVYYIFMCTAVHLNFISNVCCRERKENCQTCKDIVSAFYKGLEKTAKANFGGGNTAWEERALGTYARSETRLVEIMEQLCESSESECHAMVEEHEEVIENWWFKRYNETVKEDGFKQWFCIDEIKVCCQNGTYGQDCKECPGGKERPCSGRGSCKGDGTRKGDGTCSCSSGYDGDECNDCADGFFEDGQEDSKLKCTACHESCATGCSGPNAADCIDCKDGWIKTENEGCEDKNECEEPDKCDGGKYCVNTEGSYKCEDCHRSCEGNCTGEGSRGCKECKAGYVMSDDDGCKDTNECEEGNKCEEGKYCVNTEGSFNCEDCHQSCEGGCTDDGPKGCKKCKDGFHMTEDEGCQDDDECKGGGDTPLCGDNEYCSNTPGSFECKKCHEGCTTCSSEGLKGCLECADGYEKADTGCKDIDECAGEGKKQCPNKHEVCTNTPGGFTCDCDMGYERTGNKCTKVKGKKKKTKKKKKSKQSKENQFLEDLAKGMYLSPLQLKLGSLIHAVFFAALIGAFKKGSRVALAVLALFYSCCVWYVSRTFRKEKP